MECFLTCIAVLRCTHSKVSFSANWAITVYSWRQDALAETRAAHGCPLSHCRYDWQRAMTIRHACCGHYSQGASDLVGFRECTRTWNFSGLPKMRESHHTHSHLLLTWSFCHGRGDGIDVLARPLAAQASEQITSARRPQVWQSALWIWALPWDRSATRLVSFIVLGQ